MKQNDWIVATLNNPTFDAGDFQHIADMTLDNTQMLSRDQYLKSRFIRENDRFKNDQGEFSEEIFNTFYNNAASEFAKFSTENIVDNYEYSMWDVMRPSDGKIKNPNFTISTQDNPEHMAIGISGFNEVSNSRKSRRELAQNSKIWNPETQSYLDKSVNDLSFFEHPVEYFKSLFDDPIVYATYDEDEVDEKTGKILHKKGEWKVNELGEYYTEKLNGRSLMGKQVVSSSDYLTSENSSINEYDFFDSDDLQKSVSGTIAKNVTAVIPMLIPYVNTAYSGLLVAREISKSLPMLYGMAMSLSGTDNVDSKWMNTAAAYGQRFTGSTSDYAQENIFSFENFGNLMSDVALQWGQQKFIASTFSKLSNGSKKAIDTAYAKAQGEYLKRAKAGFDDLYSGKLPTDRLAQYIGTSNPVELKELLSNGKWMETAFGKAALNKYLPAAQKIAESRIRTGQDLSLVYMAMISNTDVYQSVLEKGGTPQEAAAIALGSMIGMFSVDKYLGLGEMFFNDEPARRAIREAARHNAELLMKSAGIQQAEIQTKKGIMGLIQRGIETGKKTVSDYRGAIKDRSLGFVGKSLGEGLEEVSEELVADASKYMGELAGQLGYFSQTDYGAGDNAFERYAMSFFGGAAGGGLFYGVDLVQNRNKETSKVQNEITYLLRQGKKDEIFAELDRLRKQGKLGSKNLSYNTTTDENGQTVHLSAETEDDSQSTYVYNTLKKTINQLDMILNENQVSLSEDELFDRMVQGEYRANALTDFLKGSNKENVKEVSYITRYQQDFQELVQKITNKDSEIKELLDTTPDPAKRSTDFQEKLTKLQQEKQELLQQRDYLFGEGSLGYVEKMLFAMDTNLSGQFISLTYDQFVRNKTGKSVSQLTEQEDTSYRKQFEEYSKTKKMSLDQAFKLFKEMHSKLNPEIEALAGRDLSKEIEQFKQIAELDPYKQFLTFDSQLEGESDEDYQQRYIRRENETEEQFQGRFQSRLQTINKYNQDHLLEWINNLAKASIDRNTFRTIQSKLGVLRKNVYNEIIEQLQVPGNTELQQKLWNIIKNIGPGTKDRRKLYKQIRTAISESVHSSLVQEYSDRLNLDQWDMIKDDLEMITGEYPETPLTKRDIYVWIDAWMQNQIAKGNTGVTINDAIAVLEGYDWDFNPEGQGLINNQIIDFYNRVAAGLISISDPEADEVVEITEGYINTLAKDVGKSSFNEIKKILTNKVFKDLNENEILKTLTNLENVSFINNPVIPIIKQISQKFRNGDTNVEELLEEVYQQYTSGESAKEFQLTDSQLQALEQFKQDLEMAKAFVYAATVKSSYENPIGHNKSVNEFVANHSDVFGAVNSLPEISEETGNFLINEANNYEKEINSWIERHQRNTADKVQKFIDADVAFNKSRLELYKVNRDSFKISPTLDLLDGYENLALNNSLASIVQIEELLHRNYKKAIRNGVTLEQILDVMLPKLVNLDSLKSQITSKLDETITYSKLTDYDKLALLLSNFALSDSSFYTKLKNFINTNTDLAPLSIQEYAAKLAQAQQNNPELMNKALRYLRNKLNLKLPILDNTTIITGVGGSGKTQAVAKLSSTNGEDAWLSGPTSSQVDVLLESLPKGRGMSKEELFEVILGKQAASEFLNSTKYDETNDKWVDSTKGKYYTTVPGLDGNTTVVLKDSVKVNKITNAPKLLVIDEATHFNTAELQVIGKFARENGINVFLLGDDNQNGFSAPGLMYNFGREVALAWRTPKLFISLRDNNIQKMANLQSTINILDQLQMTSGQDELAEVTKKLLDEDFKQFAFRYYNGDKFFGELITDAISPELMAKISPNETIGFIGDESSPHYKQLKDSGKNVIPINPTKVQGREFDYVVIDKDWKLTIDRSKLVQTGINLRDFVRDLYTMISRSRKGTILIDRGLSNLVSNIEDEFTGESTSIKSATEKFRQTRLQQIEQALAGIEPEEEEQEDWAEESEPSTNIDGTKTTTEQLEDETSSSEDNESGNEKEVAESEEEERRNYENITQPIRVYSNISYSGIDTSQDEWSNPTDSKTDLGIFLRSVQIVKEGREKYELVKKLMQLKSILTYGTDYYDRLPVEIRRLIPEEAFKDIEYYVSIENESPTNRLVGLTDLDQDKRIVKDKVITLKARIPVKDDNGQIVETYTITVGGLSDPDVWDRPNRKNPNISNKAAVRLAIQKRIDEGAENAVQLQKYLDNLDANILSYQNRIAELVDRAKDGSYMQRINNPQNSGLTTLIQRDGKLRLENINSNYSPFDNETGYAVKSKIYSIVDDIPGMRMSWTDSTGREVSLKGKAVMYVSSNILLNPDELESMYMAQKQDPTLTPQVRMVILNNEGVSFTSLYRRKYQDIYTIANKGLSYRLPFESEPMAIRMYMAAWNFRSNLKRFLQNYNDWLRDNNLSESDVEDLCKLDNSEYNRIRGDREYLSEEDYRSQVSDDVRDKIKLIWDFNDRLSDRVRQFRLGYSSQNGAYIRKLTNLKEGGFYEDINNTLGIYINPSLANQYNNILDALFENIINKVIPTEQNPLQYIDKQLVKGWFGNITKDRSLSIKMYDSEGKELNSELNLPGEDALSMLPILLIETSKFINIRGIDPDQFDYRMSENPNSRYFIKFGNETLNWLSLVGALDGGQVQIEENAPFVEGAYPPGIRPLSVENGQTIGAIDKRIENMFNLMFHGMISTSVENDFNRGDIRATDAKFKFGFFTDPILVVKEDGTQNVSAPVATNRKLFSTSVVPGFPILGISLDPYVEEEITQPEVTTTEEETDATLEQAKAASIQKLSQSNISLSDKALAKITSIEDLYNLVNSEINTKFTQYFEGQDLSSLDKLITGVKINGNTLEFTYFTSSPELNGQSIQSYEWKGKSLSITLSDGTKKSVQIVRGKLVWNDVSEPNPAQRTVGEVISQINQAISGLSDSLEQEEKEGIEMAIQEAFKGNQESTVASEALIRKALNKVQERLQEMTDESDSEWTSILNKALTNLKNISCTI